MKKVNKNQGITLVSLVITIIVLLILAGISIQTITGNNSIIDQAINAKEKSEIQNEREIIDKSVSEAIGKNRYGLLSYDQFKDKLDKNSNNGIELEQEDLDFYVTFIASQRVYFINKDGEEEYLGTYDELVNTAFITASPESDTTPKLTQSTDLTVTTAIAKQDDEVFIHYAWSKDANTEPSSYTATTYTTESSKRRKVTVSSIDTDEGNYYLWVKVILNEAEVQKKLGPYAIKSHTTLVATNRENATSSGFLGSDNFTKSNVIKRSTINSVTLLDSFTDSKGVTHSIDDSNCWDVSQAQDRSILAWYEEAKDSDNNTIVNSSNATMYDVTIAQKGGVNANSDSSYLFYNVGQGGKAENVITGLEYLDTQMTTIMSRMFLNCNSRTLNIDNWNTGNVTTMYCMFNKSKVERLNLNKWNTSKVTTLESTFEECSNLEVLNVSNWDVSNVTKMGSWGYDYGGTFEDCISLKSVDVSKWNTKKVKTMTGMFRQCKELTQIDVNNLDTSNCEYMDKMFEGCTKLESINVSSFDTKKVTAMNSMFNGCKSLTTLDLSSFVTPNLNICSSMFRDCTLLTTLDVSSLDTSNVTRMVGMFMNCQKLISLDLSSFNTANVTSMAEMFRQCGSLTSLNISSFNTSKVKDMSYMFADCQFENINVSSFDTGVVTNMGYMFINCSKLKSINLSNFNTSSVTDMKNMFTNCSTLIELDLNSFNTHLVNNMYGMFYKCWKLTTLHISNFDTSNVTTMALMFDECNSLEEVDLSTFNTTKVTTMNAMFDYCSNLKSINLSSFSTPVLTNTTYMFRDCKKLETLKINNFNTNAITSFNNMFGTVPTTVQITTNAATKTWLNTNFSSYTNIVVPST